MSDGLDNLGDTITEEVVDLNLGRDGEALPAMTNKILLVDADTVLFTACLNSEIVDELLPRKFYTQMEWKLLMANSSYHEESHSVMISYPEDVDAYIHEKLAFMMEKTGTTKYELHLTGGGRSSFRYNKIDKLYKQNRKGGRAPAGLHEAKVRWVEDNPLNVFMWDDWEADDMVVSLKRDNPNKYILAAVDKDVLYSLPGRHFNYYTSAKYSIDMRWIQVDKLEAMKHHYLQTLTGDPGDNVPGLVGIGPKKAAKILEGCEDVQSMWLAVVEAYESHNKTIIDAITTMRLVNMHQLLLDKGEYKLELWKPSTTSYTQTREEIREDFKHGTDRHL